MCLAERADPEIEQAVDEVVFVMWPRDGEWFGGHHASSGAAKLPSLQSEYFEDIARTQEQ